MFCTTGSRTREGPTTAMTASTSRIITPLTAPRLRANRRQKILLDRVCVDTASPGNDARALNAAADHYPPLPSRRDRKSTRLNSSHTVISYAVFCLKKKKQHQNSRCATQPDNTHKTN